MSHKIQDPIRTCGKCGKKMERLKTESRTHYRNRLTCKVCNDAKLGPTIRDFRLRARSKCEYCGGVVGHDLAEIVRNGRRYMACRICRGIQKPCQKY